MIIEAESRHAATLMVPPELRKEVRVIKLNRFTREQIAALIKELEG